MLQILQLEAIAVVSSEEHMVIGSSNIDRDEARFLQSKKSRDLSRFVPMLDISRLLRAFGHLCCPIFRNIIVATIQHKVNLDCVSMLQILQLEAIAVVSSEEHIVIGSSNIDRDEARFFWMMKSQDLSRFLPTLDDSRLLRAFGHLCCPIFRKIIVATTQDEVNLDCVSRLQILQLEAIAVLSCEVHTVIGPSNIDRDEARFLRWEKSQDLSRFAPTLDDSWLFRAFGHLCCPIFRNIIVATIQDEVNLDCVSRLQILQLEAIAVLGCEEHMVI